MRAKRIHLSYELFDLTTSEFCQRALSAKGIDGQPLKAHTCVCNELELT